MKDKAIAIMILCVAGLLLSGAYLILKEVELKTEIITMLKLGIMRQ